MLKKCLLFIILVSAKAEIFFTDCGSENMFVKKIDLSGCEQTPCSVYRGLSYLVSVTPEYISPDIDSIQVEAFVRLFGALFPVNVTIVTPGQHQCSSPYSIFNPIDFKIHFGETLLRNSAVLILQSRHFVGQEQKSSFCVSFNINLL